MPNMNQSESPKPGTPEAFAQPACSEDDTLRLDFLQESRASIYAYTVAQEAGGGEAWIVDGTPYSSGEKWGRSLREAIDMAIVRRRWWKQPNDKLRDGATERRPSSPET